MIVVHKHSATHEIAVYRALIEALGKEMYFCEREVELLVIREYTSLDLYGDTKLKTWLQYPSPRMEKLEEETLDDFRAKNEQSRPLDTDLDVGLKYVFANDKEIQEIFRGGGWDEFYAKYPNSQGLMTLSRVGFNSKMSQALAYVGNQVRRLAGAGFYMLFARDNENWALERKAMAWIS